MPVAADNDSAALVAAVRRDLFTAASDDNWTDEKILAIADDCLVGPIAASLKAAKQEWFGADFDLPLVASQAEYALPERTMFGSVENVYLIDKTTGRIVAELANASSSQRAIHQPGNDGLTGIPRAVYFRDSSLVLSPAPDSNSVSAYSITVAGFIEPAQLCKTSEAVRVHSINSGSMTLTIGSYSTDSLTNPPTGWAEGQYDGESGYRVDVYANRQPHGRKLTSVIGSLTATNTLSFSPSTTLATLSAADFAKIAVGDVISMEMTTPFVDLPRGGVPYLRRMIQKTITTAQTDSQALQTYLATEADALANFIRGMKNRHDGRGRRVSLQYSAASRFMRRRW